jgi:DNA-binding NarL/FixJ family response regulator
VSAVRVVVADDEPLVRQGLRSVLELDPELDIVAEAGDGREAVALVREHRPDLALLDIRMPRLDGIEALRRITGDPALASTRALVLTTFADEDLLVEAVRAGASGYLLKSMPPADIRAAVRSAAAGQTAVAPLLVGRLLREYAGRRTPASPVLDRLTDRETDVLREVATGRSNGEIAARLHLGEGTVKTHVAAILRKLQVRDRTQAAVAAYELGLVRPGDAAGTAWDSTR